MALTKREQRVINAFLNCVKHGEYSEDYAITLIEDNARYGWLSEAAKETFYEGLEPEPVVEPEPEPVEGEAVPEEPEAEQPTVLTEETAETTEAAEEPAEV